MSRKAKWVVFAIALALSLLASAICALPYGYILSSFLALPQNDAVMALAWTLYAIVAVLLWLALWRILYAAVKLRPRRRE
jgi:membrane protein DedA with SNARE-associated domain